MINIQYEAADLLQAIPSRSHSCSGLLYSLVHCAVEYVCWSQIKSSRQQFGAYIRKCILCTVDLSASFVFGWIAESWIGRYKAIVVGLLMSSVTVIVTLFAFIMLTFGWTPVPVIYLLCLAIIVSFGGFYTIMLPFTLDQMIGASAEELSAAVHWYYWSFLLSPLMNNAIYCIKLHFPNTKSTIPMVFLLIASLSLSAALIMDCLCHKWLDTHDKTGNPIKLIYQVLNYARRNKCPRLRSALTYIDEEHPSRIDFGKHKFGGPFTEEEVEDVKTVFRLVPLLLVSLFGAVLTLDTYDQLSLHALPTTDQTFFCVQNLKTIVCQAASFVLIPVYRFILHPLIAKYIPSMLKLMAAGFCLCIAVTVIELNVLSISHFYSNASHCIFDDRSVTGTIPIPLYWVLIIDLVNGVGVVLVTCFTYEFVIAQTPNRMRGIMMGLVVATFGFGVVGNYILVIIFQQFQTASPSCVFYYYLVLSLLLLLILIVFVILAKHYKLRERERHVNTHTIVEEHYERYYEQEEEYKRAIVHSEVLIESYLKKFQLLCISA